MSNQKKDQELIIVDSVFESIQASLEVVSTLLVTSSNPESIAKKLFLCGTIAIPHLRSLIEPGRAKQEVRILAALTLSKLGSEDGNSLLLWAIEHDDDYAVRSAQELADAGVTEAIVPICKRLRNTNVLAGDFADELIEALCQLNGGIPGEIISRYVQPIQENSC